MDDMTPMRYELVSDLPGYLRVRYGALAFTEQEGYGMAERLRAVPGVTDVRTATANGSVLVRYDVHYKLARGRVLDVLAGFSRDALPTASPSDGQASAELGDRFVTQLVLKVGGHVVRKLLLPAPLRNAWTLVRALGYVNTGARHLFGKQELSVEVLDATAIVAALTQGMFSSAASVMLLLDISALLEEYTHARSRIALEQSLALNVDDVWLVTDEGEVLVRLESVHEGDMLRVRTGAMVPVDGDVVSGAAAVNEASMTGESRLVPKEAGSSVFAGTLVDDGSIVVRARKVGADTRIRNIVQLVDESEKLKAGVQSKAERLADAIVPYSFAAFFAVLALTRNMTKALSVLMVDYSCAIKLSTPVAVMSAMREAAARGIVVKGGRYLETIAEADTIVFDKTGTLTTACPTVQRVVALGSMDEDELLRLAACLEEHFPHSMARAVVAEARRRGIMHDDEAHAEVKYIVAHGIATSIEGRHTVLGSAHYVFEDEGVEPPHGAAKAKLTRLSRGCSTIYLAIDGVLEGAICITDPLREEAARAIAALRAAGFENVVMLTGDAEGAARAAAEQLGITSYHAQVLPEDKARIVEGYRAQGHVVVMVGDGVNDSPALAAADCSVAMVDASDIAREVADVTLLRSSLDELVTLRSLGRALMHRINRNYGIIVAFNSALLAGGVAGLLQPTVSSVLHNGSTMLITAANMSPLLGDGKGAFHEEP